MIHIAESTVGRRYAGWFIRNSEHAAHVLDGLRASPLPVSLPVATKTQGKEVEKNTRSSGPKVAWGGAK